MYGILIFAAGMLAAGWAIVALILWIIWRGWCGDNNQQITWKECVTIWLWPLVLLFVAVVWAFSFVFTAKLSRAATLKQTTTLP